MPVRFGGTLWGTLIAMSIDDLLASIDSEIARLQQARALLAGLGIRGGSVSSGRTKRHRKPVLSAAARKRIGDAQRKRWAAVRKAAKTIPVKAAKRAAAPVKKRKMSAEAKKRIAAAQKKRWAAFRAAKKAVKKVPAKKVAKKAQAKKAVAVKQAAVKKAPAKKAAVKKAAPKKAPAVKAKKAAPEKTAAPATEATSS